MKLTALIITYNEEKIIAENLQVLTKISERIIIIDSYSTDSTVEIAEKLNADVYYRNFDNFSDQRNFSLKETKIESDYVLVLDADEYITKEFKNWLLANKLDSDGYYINRRFYWKGTWLRRGYYPLWLLRLGLFLYDRLNRQNSLPNSQLIKRLKQAIYFKPLQDIFAKAILFNL